MFSQSMKDYFYNQACISIQELSTAITGLKWNWHGWRYGQQFPHDFECCCLLLECIPSAAPLHLPMFVCSSSIYQSQLYFCQLYIIGIICLLCNRASLRIISLHGVVELFSDIATLIWLCMEKFWVDDLNPCLLAMTWHKEQFFSIALLTTILLWFFYN